MQSVNNDSVFFIICLDKFGDSDNQWELSTHVHPVHSGEEGVPERLTVQDVCDQFYLAHYCMQLHMKDHKIQMPHNRDVAEQCEVL